jgi:hypothetical protein
LAVRLYPGGFDGGTGGGALIDAPGAAFYFPATN